MSNSSPKLYGVILDTHIVISILNFEYNNLFDIIRNEDLFVLVCDELRHEYIRQISKQSVSGNKLLFHFLEKLQEIKKLVTEPQPQTESNYKIQSRKDQVHVNCAICSTSKAWIIVTNDQQDFSWEINKPSIPIIVDYNGFSNQNMRENIIAQCKHFAFYPTN